MVDQEDGLQLFYREAFDAPLDSEKILTIRISHTYNIVVQPEGKILDKLLHDQKDV